MNVYTGRFLQFLGIVISKGSYETLNLAVISNFHHRIHHRGSKSGTFDYKLNERRFSDEKFLNQ